MQSVYIGVLSPWSLWPVDRITAAQYHVVTGASLFLLFSSD